MQNPEPITKYMATKLVTFTPDVDLRDAIATIVKRKISGAPVINEHGDLVGMLSEKDCINAIVEGPYNQGPGATGTVGDFMSTNVKTIDVNSNVLEVSYQFALTNYRRFPVCENGKLVGQISRSDILRAILKMTPKINHVPSSWVPRVPMV
jgi:CBS domain-containing protein